MRFERITDPGHQMYNTALELYGVSFPLHEQREAASQANILREEAYCFHLIYEDDSFIGLLLCWETEHFLYIEHLCILPQMRGKNYGERALELLRHRGKHVILEIDPPVDAISIRRKGFYQRNGFVENPYPHIHPPYHRESAGHELVLMTSPVKLTPEEYNRFNTYLRDPVMKDAYIE